MIKSLKFFLNTTQNLNMSRLSIKVFVCWSVIMNLTWASKECTTDTPWNCHLGGINITLSDELVKKLIEQKEGIRREFEIEDIQNHINILRHKKQEIPEFFDSRIKWPMCPSISRIQSQGNCGTCWAFVSTTSTTDRLCIATKGRIQYDFSQQDIITCCEKCYEDSEDPRCIGAASLVSSLMYMIKYGVVDAKCKPYDTTKLEDGCKKSCVKKTMSYKKQSFNMSFIVLGLVAGAKRPTSTIEDAQIEIMKYGPIGSRLQYTPDSFHEYKKEVYINRDTNPEDDGGHGIKIIGWGTENKVPYWLCANSWSTKFGELGGFFKIRRGTNELGVEKLFAAADTDPKNRPQSIVNIQGLIESNDVSNAVSFIKTLQMYKITIIVVSLLKP